jgi:hypothetical protein
VQELGLMRRVLTTGLIFSFRLSVYLITVTVPFNHLVSFIKGRVFEVNQIGIYSYNGYFLSGKSAIPFIIQRSAFKNLCPGRLKISI